MRVAQSHLSMRTDAKSLSPVFFFFEFIGTAYFPLKGTNYIWAQSSHHPVAAGECTQCHDPHAAGLSDLLLALSPDLCLTCHADLESRMASQQTHSPAARDCLRCHVPHAATTESLLAKDQQPLCAECHDLESDSFSTAHLGIDPGVMTCTRCHDPHASDDAKYFRAEIHAPFALRSCEECHLVD